MNIFFYFIFVDKNSISQLKKSTNFHPKMENSNKNYAIDFRKAVVYDPDDENLDLLTHDNLLFIEAIVRTGQSPIVNPLNKFDNGSDIYPVFPATNVPSKFK